jgi:ribosome recycling factor
MSDKKREKMKLVHKYKKEMKGAVREIRRDRDFLAKVQLKETMKRYIDLICGLILFVNANVFQ